jgi:hypothetical protein
LLKFSLRNKAGNYYHSTGKTKAKKGSKQHPVCDASVSRAWLVRDWRERGSSYNPEETIAACSGGHARLNVAII